MNNHLHCPSCNHCASWHRLAQIRRVSFLPGTGPILLQCAGCDPNEKTGVQVCPAGEKPDEASETMRIMFIQDMRDSISETGI